MPSYHVFVDGPADASPTGIERLAAAIAEHYGLPVTELRARIASGRFRVKGNCDGPTADMYVRDLTRLGARCSTEESSPQNRANTPLPFPAVGAKSSTLPPPQQAKSSTLPPPAKPSTPPKSSALPPKSTLPPPAKPSAPPPVGGYQSGLSAAFSSGDQEMSLGALEDGAMLKLASVDGADDNPAAPQAAFEPPSASNAAQPKPKSEAGKPAKATAPKDEPLDMFAPPDAGSDEFKVELAAEDAAEMNARKRSTTPPATEVVAPVPQPAAGGGRYSRPSLHASNAQSDAAPRSNPLANPRIRFAVGIVVAIVIGFVPAHLVASMRETSAFEAIDKKIAVTQQQADTPDAYAALDQFRSEQLSRKYDDRRTIVITALLIWAAVGGAVAYGWFKRVPWERFEAR